jgi:hypothetical protein
VVADLTFGNKFFMTMNEQQQQSFFQSIFNLSASNMAIHVGEATDISTENQAVTISTSALLETLSQLRTNVGHLAVSNFALTRQSDVQALSTFMLAKCPLYSLRLESIECLIDGCHKPESDESDGFLDPLFYAASGLYDFYVSTETRPVHSTVVSPRALRAMFAVEGNFRTLSLRGLDLNDSHIFAIVDGLSTPDTHLECLELDSNPGITAQGYDALFNLINLANVVGGFNHRLREWIGFRVDDKAWEGKLNLVSEMNSKYGRLEYLTNGNFTSEERKFQWLEKVANLPIPDRNFRGTNEEWDAKHLNFIWYALCQNPEMMRT